MEVKDNDIVDRLLQAHENDGNYGAPCAYPYGIAKEAAEEILRLRGVLSEQSKGIKG